MRLTAVLLLTCGSRSLVREQAQTREQGSKGIGATKTDKHTSAVELTEEEKVKVRENARSQMLAQRISDQILLHSNVIDDRFMTSTLQGIHSEYFEDALSKWLVLNLPFLVSDAGFMARTINEKLAQTFVDEGPASWIQIVGLEGQDVRGRGFRPCAVPALVQSNESRDLVDVDPPCNEALEQTLNKAITAAQRSESWKKNQWKWSSAVHHESSAPAESVLQETDGVSTTKKSCAVHTASQTWGSVHKLLKDAAHLICSARRNSRASACRHGRRPSAGSCASIKQAYSVKYRLCGVLCGMREIGDAQVSSCDDFAVAPPTGSEASQALVQLGGECTEDSP